jgi:predicted RNA-binding protein
MFVKEEEEISMLGEDVTKEKKVEGIDKRENVQDKICSLDTLVHLMKGEDKEERVISCVVNSFTVFQLPYSCPHPK